MKKQSTASVKARLMNRGKTTGKTMQELLVAYGLERTIYRLSVSPYAENFTLKGGIFLYALFDGDYARATVDIDLLAQRIGNDTEKMKRVFTEIFSIETEDPLRFDFDSLDVHPITEFKDYHGVNASIMAYLDRTRIAISIDIGFGDVIYPERVKMEFPVVLSDESPRIYAYSLASCVAEKFEAIVSLGYENSRFKDYYDLYVLASKYDFDRRELQEAFKETFEHRNTGFDDIVAFEDGFADDAIRQSRWNAFTRKKKTVIQVTLQETIDLIRSFVGPVVDGIIKDIVDVQRWDHTEKAWN